MAKLSRVKKYENLRNSLTNDGELQLKSKDLDEYANKLSKLDVKSIESDNNIEETSTSVDADYMNDFIKEVKNYNIDQGNRVCEDTQIDILNRLTKSSSNSKETNIVQDLQQTKAFDFKQEEKEEITRKVIEETMDIPFVKGAINPVDDDFLKQLLSKEEPEDENLDMNVSLDPISFANKVEEPVVEEEIEEKKSTPKFDISLDDDDFEDDEDDEDAPNKLLNVILIILIVILLIILGVFGYWVLMNQGVI